MERESSRCETSFPSMGLLNLVHRQGYFFGVPSSVVDCLEDVLIILINIMFFGFGKFTGWVAVTLRDCQFGKKNSDDN